MQRAVFAWLLLFTSSTPAAPVIARFPDIHADAIVFVHAGDLYRVSRAGGAALRLTAHPGEELYPKFSPDGSEIAFSAEYNGTRQVYVMPAAGGEPRQLTWYNDVGPLPPRGGTDNRVLDWSPDGRCILVRMNRVGWDERGGRPYCVPAVGGLETPLPIPECGGGSYSPDGQAIVYTPIESEFRSWKRYRGGRAQDLWIFNLADSTARRLTAHPATDQQPMWLGETIYFASDRDGTLNLYALPSTADTTAAPQPLTRFDDFDVLWPSAGPGGIVFEKGGALWHYDPATGTAAEVPVRIVADFAETRPRFVDAAGFVDSFALAPDGERAAIAARGELFALPAKPGVTRNLSRTSALREISVTWSPDGRWLAYLSDASGDYELWLRAADGRGEPRQLTRDSDAWLHPPVWSPDASRIALADSQRRLRIVEVSSGAVVDVDRSEHGDLEDYRFAPDSRWLAYVKTNASRNTSIWLYSLESGTTQQLTPDETREREPVFDPEGRWLYFLSDRDFGFRQSAYEFNFVYDRATRIYAAALAADGTPVHPRRQAEVDPAPVTKPRGGLRIDVPGFNQRIEVLRPPAGRYAGLAANADGVFFVAMDDAGASGELRYLARDGNKARSVAQIDGYALAANGERLLLKRGKRFAIVPAQPDADFDAGKLDLSGLELRIEPRVEWRQIFIDAWRILRHQFYDPGMHGVDWAALRARYEPWLDAVDSRGDLDYVLHELAGELRAGHVYLERGPGRGIKRRAGGLLGAELVADASGYVRIQRVFAGENWDPARRSPLTEPGVGVVEGELILAIDGISTRGVDNVYRLLEGKADRLVELDVGTRPDPAASRRVLVRTIASETALRYLDWVAQRRRLVEQLSAGRIGYIHLPDTGPDGSRELFRGLLAYSGREALIIDDRYNGGGFVPDRLVEWLGRTPLNYWKSRGLAPYATPLLAHAGPKAMLINGLSGSGGDALPYYFRELKLGPLIGTRTWGGLIGIDPDSHPKLVDGSMLIAPSFRFLDRNGRWAVEDEGVAPDIEIVDRPDALAAGRDPSIEAAVAHLLDTLAKQSPRAPDAPPAPSRFPRDLP